MTTLVHHKAEKSDMFTSKQKDYFLKLKLNAYIQRVALPHGARMLDLQQRDFIFVEIAAKDVLDKAQVILHKIMTE